jgi:hypothetical protein
MFRPVTALDAAAWPGLYWNLLPTGWGVFFLVGGIPSVVLQWGVDSRLTAAQRERVYARIPWDRVVFQSALLI